MKKKLDRQRQRIDNLIAIAERIEDEINDSEEILGHWAKYLCIMVAGYLENVVQLMLSDYVHSNAKGQVRNFVHQKLKRVTNLKEEKLGQLLGSFDAEWREMFCKRITNEEKSAIDSIVANRNNIAHGIDVGITIARVREYYARIDDILMWIRNNMLRS